MARQCSFCSNGATEVVADKNDIFPCCWACARAWESNPGFTRGSHRKRPASTEGAGKSVADQDDAGGMAIWRYLIRKGEHCPSAEELNDVGAQGWELVSYTTTNQHLGATLKHLLVFKRPAQP